MARFIVIDNNSGYVWGDSADLDGKSWSGDDAVDYVRALDESLGEHGRTYEWGRGTATTTQTGYHVYRADVDGSEAVPVVHDGQDRETIKAVESSCRYVGFLACLEG